MAHAPLMMPPRRRWESASRANERCARYKIKSPDFTLAPRNAYFNDFTGTAVSSMMRVAVGERERLKLIETAIRARQE